MPYDPQAMASTGQLNPDARGYDAACDAFAAGSWAESLQLAAQVLATDPYHAGAFELLTAARQRIDLGAGERGERRLLTVVMCDLIDSTRLTQRLGRDAYQEMLLTLHRICVDAVTRYEGRIAQYRGDGVLAYFCYPQAHEDDARRGVLASLMITESVAAALPESDFAVRLGVATGPVLIGVMGAGQWTTSDMIIGDAPNLAARLQELAHPNEVVISHETYKLVSDVFVVDSDPPVLVKSFAEPQLIHRVRGERQGYEPVDGAASRFVGRSHEIDRLTRAWAAVLNGERRTVMISGPAGIGKSRLSSQMLGLVIASGGRVLQLRCTTLLQRVALAPVTDAVRRLLGLEDLEQPADVAMVRDKLLTVGAGQLPADDADWILARLLGVDFEHGLLPEQLRLRTFGVLTSLFEVMARTEPLLVLVDDLHNADPSTLEFLAHAAARVEVGFCLMTTSRPAGPVLPEAEVVELHPLDDGSVAEMIRSLLPDADAAEIARLVARADGIPLYADQLARWSNESPAIDELPAALDAVLTARLDELEPETRELASAMAVIGSDIAADLLAEIAEMPSDVLERRIATLRTRRVIELDNDRVGEAYRFHHVLLREAAYNRLPTRSRTDYHDRCADSLVHRSVAGHGVPPEVIATHLLQATRRAESLDWWERAGSGAAGSGAHAEAAGHFQEALRLVDSLDTDAQPPRELALQLGFALSGSAIWGYSSLEPMSAFERADELGRGMGDSPALLGAMWGLYSFYLVRGEIDRAIGLARRSERIAEMTGMSALVGTAASIAAYAEFFRGDPTGARIGLARGVDATGVTVLPHDPAIVSRVLLGVCEWMLGDEESGESHVVRAIGDADALDGPAADFTRAYVLCYAAWYAQMRGEPERAERYAERALAIASTHQFITWQGAAWLHLAAAWCAQDRTTEGIDVLSGAIEAWRKAGSELMVPYFLGQLARGMMRAGRYDEALRVLDEALVLADLHNDHIYDPELHRMRAEVADATGDTLMAGEALVRAATVARAHGSVAFERRTVT